MQSNNEYVETGRSELELLESAQRNEQIRSQEFQRTFCITEVFLRRKFQSYQSDCRIVLWNLFVAPKLSTKSFKEIYQTMLTLREGEQTMERFERIQLEEQHARIHVWRLWEHTQLQLRRMHRKETKQDYTTMRNIIPTSALLIEIQLKESNKRCELSNQYCSTMITRQIQFHETELRSFLQEFDSNREAIKELELQSLREGLEDDICVRRDELKDRQLIINTERLEYRTIIRICERINIRPLRVLAAKALCDHSESLVFERYFRSLHGYYRAVVSFRSKLRLARQKLETSAVRIRSKLTTKELSQRKILRAGCSHARGNCKQHRRGHLRVVRECSYSLTLM